MEVLFFVYNPKTLTMATQELINSISAASNVPTVELKEEERVALLAACTNLKSKLETPREATLQFLFAPHQSVALRLAVDMGLFDASAKLSADRADVRLDDLAFLAGVDPLLVRRVMRFLVGMGIFSEKGEGVYTPLRLAKLYVTASPLAQGIIHMFNEVVAAFPSYFSSKGYKNPDDAYDGVFQFARKTHLHCFDWLATKPRLQHAFNSVLSISRTAQGTNWFEYFPVLTKLQLGSTSDPLLVDIGGGRGHDLIAFKEQYPDLPGELILQDIPAVLKDVNELPAGIRAMEHDFFSPQPIKHAKAYYLSNILHDWPETQALKILEHIKNAMGPDSILLVSENVLPETGVTLLSASIDFMMMANFSALERTKKQFESLLDRAGFTLVGSWAPPNLAEGEDRRLLEAVLTG
ncbi:quercetin 3-O-methyltransferase 1 [Coccidioides immitis RMSCC 3703]|uniref:Quercetin 3-O-methyltransferase 1 n=2 Tax=Coccidioides immitis TaxID=5501 RepID=A0A0J8QPS4_COCIT|nr:quercetin 3-O-methyltransferase 1 [Coccidioides immitis RMSCC 2394]KMU74155.1 quercetin 3-O-methyltransferase 1 [Coccidioides immitis RMSCC 3703]